MTIMCGRYTNTGEIRDIRIQFNLDEIFSLFPRYNIAPGQNAPVIVNADGVRRLAMMRWGLVPSWAKDPSIGNRMINARAETVAQKPAFKRLLGKRRCLVLADGFYEWRREGKRKFPMRIVLKDTRPFAFAGLWDAWKRAEGDELHSFTIITTEANELLRPIHDRMPVILDGESGAKWLDPELTEPRLLTVLLLPFASELMEAYEVSTMVNSPANDRPECISPLEN